MDPTAQAASIALNKKLEQLSHEKFENLECTIYRVHRQLRSVNPKAYEPEVIAIGPYHRDKAHLKMMDDHKLRNLQSLIKARRCNVEACAAAVGELEPEARKCYADQRISLNSSEFVEMLVLDGCFIVELVQKFDEKFPNEKNDSIFEMRWMIVSLQRDLMLFENQVPFFVLSKLFELVKYPGQDSTLLSLLSNFFSGLYPGTGQIEEPKVDAHRPIKHLLDLIHRSWLPPSGGKEKEEERGLEFVSSAAGLKEANVKFVKNERAATLFDIDFKNGVMLMPPLSIDDTTECVLRNLIAYEQYFEHSPHNFVTDYVTFLDGLINSPKDVELLSRNEILRNCQGDDEVVAKMVNRLCDSVVYSTESFFYAGISEDLKEHCKEPWNKWMAKLRRNYLNSPWAIISIVVAVVLLLLTVTQTLFSILQVV